MILNDSTLKITVETAEAMVTNQLSFYSEYTDTDPSLSLTTGNIGMKKGFFDTTPVVVVDFPSNDGAGKTYERYVQEFQIINKDTIPHTVTVKYVGGGVADVEILIHTLDPGDSTIYSRYHKGGYSANSSQKTTVTTISTPRVTAIPDGVSFTPTIDTSDINKQANTQGVGNLAMNAPVGTPTDGQKLEIIIKSTNVQTYTWNAIFAGSVTTALPATSSGATKTDRLFFEYNSTSSKWELTNLKLGYT